ncbi:MAG TPA: class I tRNA ligase family protein, partial [Candidatus Paceibacterota bacterium]|nr:class I tRNA ligase family protein [Candidatus Paceibacterota bacterium]
RDGRFGEWLREIKDWAISRERYWGTPLPVWVADDGERVVLDSIKTLKKYSKKSGNTYFVMRHCQTENNLQKLWSFNLEREDVLTAEGKAMLQENVQLLADKNIDLIVASPYSRTQQTAALVAEALGIPKENIITDERIGEWRTGDGFDGKPIEEYFKLRNKGGDRYQFKLPGGESYADVLRRSGACLYDIDARYKNKNILFVSHGGSTRALMLHGEGVSFDTLFASTRSFRNFDNAEIRALDFVPLPHNEDFELDLHRPYIDSVVLEKDSTVFRRVKEVLDVWFDSGAMPFAQDHQPFSGEALRYPADFISEAIDQTRGWFYTLHAIGVLMGQGKAYNNVICLGHLLDAQGKKMSKSVGNVVDPWEQIEKYGVDALRLWMYSVNQPGDSKNYDEKTVDELVKKVFNLTYNVLSFYELYRDPSFEVDAENYEPVHVLDVWITARLNQFIALCTENLDTFKLFEPVRALRDFVDDLSTWYLRRSRERIKEGDRGAKQTLYIVLKTLAKVMAPFAPFTAEDLWQKLRNESDAESVHVAEWPKGNAFSVETLAEMQTVRDYCTTGNMLRKKENIPVRQPLATFFIPTLLSELYQEIIKDELNVKHIRQGEVSLDTHITSELKAEGNLRELIRAVQDKRKEKNLQPKDRIALSLSAAYKETVVLFEEELKKAVAAEEIIFTEGEDISIELKKQ